MALLGNHNASLLRALRSWEKLSIIISAYRAIQSLSWFVTWIVSLLTRVVLIVVTREEILEAIDD